MPLEPRGYTLWTTVRRSPRCTSGRCSMETRTCGHCEQALPLDQFYKDGKDNHGVVRYRRDCKDCFRKTRLTERRAKRPAPVRAATPRRVGKK
jgi:hypothetical protein